MNRKTIATLGLVAVLAGLTVTGCSTSASTSPSTPTVASLAPSAMATDMPMAPTTPAANPTSTSIVLPVTSNPIVNTATGATLTISKAAVEDNTDPATGKAINDRLQLTLKNTGATALTGLEVYYTMTDIVTGAKEAYYQKLTGLKIPAGAETTVYFDNQNLPGHFPENQFSIYRSSTNEVDFGIQVSAKGAKIATATAVKSTGTGEKVD